MYQYLHASSQNHMKTPIQPCKYAASRAPLGYDLIDKGLVVPRLQRFSRSDSGECALLALR